MFETSEDATNRPSRAKKLHLQLKKKKDQKYIDNHYE